MFCPRCHRPAEEVWASYCPFDGAALIRGSRSDHIPTRPDERRGTVIGKRYLVRGLLGQGGMAAVYLAEDGLSKEPVAIKILDRNRVRQAGARERFLREIDIAKRVRHPHIVPIIDAGELPDRTPYIVLEYVFGESLGDLLRRDQRIDPLFALWLTRMAAQALAAAHRASIIHRDVKPDNLLLAGERGDPYTLKVVDFGLAKLLDSPLTGAGIAIGTIAYMPPEQLLADPIDARADIYGLGVVLYRLVTRQLPFGTNNDPLVVARHLFQPPPSPRALTPGLDPRAEAVIYTAMRKHPENRYASMDVMVEDIDHILGKPNTRLTLAPLRHDPDQYEPRSPFSRRVAGRLYEKLSTSGRT